MATVSLFLVRSRRLGALLLFTVALFGTVQAERLPLTYYTVSDGLAHNTINRIVRDSSGFLWFCTEEGLTRYDGYQFTSFTTAQGLPDPNVNDLIETRAGEYWLATSGGLVHFNPRGKPWGRVVYATDPTTVQPPMFMVIVPADMDRRARAITAVLEGRDGTLWCGTFNGLYRLEKSVGRLALLPVDLRMPREYAEQRYINRLLEDNYGSLWVATPDGLYRRWPDGNVARYSHRDGLPDDFLHDLLLDHRGQLWVGTRNRGLFCAAFDGTHADPSITFTLSPHDYLQSEWVNQLVETSDHKIWAGLAHGLLELTPDDDKRKQHYRIYTLKNGLSDDSINALSEDSGGNLWLGSGQGGGVMRLATGGFVTYDRQDGITAVQAIFEDRGGVVCFRGYVLGDRNASIFDGGKLDLLNLSTATYWHRFGRFDGQRLTWFLPDALKGKNLGWVGEGITLQSRQSGEWWVTAGLGEGLYQFPSSQDFTMLKRARPLGVFGPPSVLGARQVFRIFEDSQGRIWVSTIDSAKGNGLARWDRESGQLRDLSTSVNLPSLHDDLARSFGEDSAGNVWIGFNAGLARFHDGTFSFFGAGDGLPQGAVVDIHMDRLGRLWLASTRGGLIRMDDPGGSRPLFTSYNTAQGLSSDVVSVVTEDAYGRIYAGTGKGLDRLDPRTGRITRYGTADGLSGGKIYAVFLDRSGYIWVGTSQGVSRFLPEPESQAPPPPVLITGLHVSGTEQNISALGETDVHLADLSFGANQLQIDFVGLGFASGESLRYQFMLDGADKTWGEPTTQRSVNFANLAPGRYRFLVRAVNAAGVISPTPAAVIFRILPPVWRRWWFVMLAVFFTGAFIYAFYRYRVARLLEVANMRTRIATDLHDDIGSNLTRIAILSEIVKQQSGNTSGRDQSKLASIADIARESVASMGDIVWAINPERDTLRDLKRRMRQHAEEVFSAHDIRLTFKASDEEQFKLGVDVRRDLFLIFKEAVNNAARHAQPAHVRIDLYREGTSIVLEVSDDGVGFDMTAESDGQGLTSIRRRAESLGAKLVFESHVGDGTRLLLKIPLARSRYFG